MLRYNQYLLLCVIFVGVHSEREQPQLSSQVATNDDVDDQMIPPYHRNLMESFTSRSNETKEYLPSKNSISLTRPKRNNQIDIPNKDGCTALHIAIENNHTIIVQLLEKNGADINVRTFNGSTLLHVKAAEGDLRGVQKVLSNSHKVQVDIPNKDGFTALQVAIMNNRTNMVQLLEKYGADINVRTFNGSTLLHVKAAEGDLQIVKSILDTGKASLVIRNDNSETPLQLAEIGGHIEVVKLLKNVMEEATARLIVVAKEGNAHEIPSLIKKGADTERRDEGLTPLMWGACKGHSEVVKRLSAAGADVMEFLVTKGGADASARTRNGSTILHLAAANGNLKAVQSILVNCPDLQLDSKNNEGSTALHIAAKQGELQIVKSLVDTGKASLAIKNDNMETPLLLAERGGHCEVAKLLKSIEEATARLIVAAKKGYADEIPSLIKKGADIERRDEGRTPLMWAARNGHSEVVRRLRASGADVMAKDNAGWTPLMWATIAGSLDIVEFLTEEGADRNAKDNMGLTALLHAAFRGKLDILKYLLQKGAKVDEADRDGRTPLILAAWHGHLSVVKYLVENGAALNLKDIMGYTALKEAIRIGQHSVVDYLKSIGATT